MGILDYFKTTDETNPKNTQHEQEHEQERQHTNPNLSEADALKQAYLKNPIRISLTPEEQQLNSSKPSSEPLPTQTQSYKQQVKDKRLQYDFTQREEKILDMAKENCSDFEIQLYQCFRKGSLLDRLQFCNLQQVQLSKCIQNQKTILENLGYGKFTNPPQKDMALAEAAYDVLLEQETQPK